MSRDDDTDTTVDTGQFFDSNSIAHHIQTGTAVFFRIGQAQPAFLCHFLDNICRKFIILIQGKSNRFYFSFRKTTDFLA